MDQENIADNSTLFYDAEILHSSKKIDLKHKKNWKKIKSFGHIKDIWFKLQYHMLQKQISSQLYKAGTKYFTLTLRHGMYLVYL